MNDPVIRAARASDKTALTRLYPQAFPEEDLVPLVQQLLDDTDNVLSLVATRAEEIIGHVVFTFCSIDGSDKKVALLGPLAVAPPYQRQGAGSALVHAGQERLREAGVAWIYVLGDPVYYGRFGFAQEDAVTPPYAIPPEWRPAWQSLDLGAGAPSPAGALGVTAPWRKRNLWQPE